MSRRRFVVLLLGTLAAFTMGPLVTAREGMSDAVTLDGPMIQGGLVLGKAPAGTRLRLDGRPVPVDAEGRFVFGFGRDAGPQSVLDITLPDGTREKRPLAIEQRRYDIQHIKGLPPKMVTPDPAVTERIRRENAQIAEARKRYTDEIWYRQGFIRPARGRISGVYGSQRILNGEPRQPHYGLDIAGPTGSPVVAPAAGIVVLAEPDHYYTGKTVLIDHGHGVNSVLMHLDSIAVTVGQTLAAGDAVGTIGSSGRATGPHLDWRVNWFDVRLDPALLLPPE